MDGQRFAAGLNVEQTLGPVPPLKVLFSSFEQQPTPTFFEAMKDIDCFPGLEKVARTTWELAQAGRMPGGDYHECCLDPDQLAVVLQYTSEKPPLYKELNRRCCSRDPQLIRPFLKFLWVLVKALQKLEPFPSPTVFRGVALDLHSEYPKGREFVWHGPCSCTKSLSVIDSFLGSGSRTQFIIELSQGQAREIRTCSLIPTEDEVLLPPGCRFRVKDVLRLDTLTQVNLVELPSEMWIVDLAVPSLQGASTTVSATPGTRVAATEPLSSSPGPSTPVAAAARLVHGDGFAAMDSHWVTGSGDDVCDKADAQYLIVTEEGFGNVRFYYYSNEDTARVNFASWWCARILFSYAPGKGVGEELDFGGYYLARNTCRWMAFQHA